MVRLVKAGKAVELHHMACFAMMVKLTCNAVCKGIYIIYTFFSNVI